MADQVLQGEWIWKKEKIQLEWWSPVAGCCTDIQETEWTSIIAMGLPLHLWSEKTFKAIGDQCGGWLETKEETSLKNYLKWARLKIRGGQRVPSEVIIEDKGLIYIIPIWSEIPTRVDVREEWKNLQRFEKLLGDRMPTNIVPQTKLQSYMQRRDRRNIEHHTSFPHLIQSIREGDIIETEQGTAVMNSEIIGNKNTQLVEIEQWPVEDVQPLDTQMQTAVVDASLWVQLHACDVEKQVPNLSSYLQCRKRWLFVSHQVAQKTPRNQLSAFLL
ncbi:hypothetical protein H5410_056650 [Solanum commersonii]|uniref:DUF4283 domain-containing protein n=1 Tax=Solanum commersonii TaxID=4109 RepID=A0A9J5WMW1_SOLCO|nr:hypothetical protein H5410_056650 [Solanum commersonii]